MDEIVESIGHWTDYSIEGGYTGSIRHLSRIYDEDATSSSSEYTSFTASFGVDFTLLIYPPLFTDLVQIIVEESAC